MNAKYYLAILNKFEDWVSHPCGKAIPRWRGVQYPCDNWDCKFCTASKLAKLHNKIETVISQWRWCYFVSISPKQHLSELGIWSICRKVREWLKDEVVRMWGFFEKQKRGSLHIHLIIITSGCSNKLCQNRIEESLEQYEFRLGLGCEIREAFDVQHLDNSDNSIKYVVKYISKVRFLPGFKKKYFSYCRPFFRKIEESESVSFFKINSTELDTWKKTIKVARKTKLF